MMRDGKPQEVNENTEDSNKELSMRDMLKITRGRKLNEDVDGTGHEEEEGGTPTNKKTVYDQQREEQKFRDYFKDLNADIKFDELKIYDDMIFWGGTIDGIIQFTYSVTSDEDTSNIGFDYLPNFSVDNPDNNEIIDRITSYYDNFYKYWRNNILA